MKPKFIKVQRLKDIICEVNRKSKTTEENFNDMYIVTKDGLKTVKQLDRTIVNSNIVGDKKSIYDTINKEFYTGDIICGAYSKERKEYTISVAKIDGYISNSCHIYKAKNRNNPIYIGYLLTNDVNIREKILERLKGFGYLRLDLDMQIEIPNIEYQNFVTKYIEKFNKRIDLEAEYIKKLQEFKSGLLEKMFPEDK